MEIYSDIEDGRNLSSPFDLAQRKPEQHLQQFAPPTA